MKKGSFYIIFSVLSIYTIEAQNSYSLNFDGESDYVEIIGESAMIANADQMTLSGWIYPRGPNADSWTQFDGFFGFRNESDADFYLLQLGNYKVEGRLRSGDGVFTIATVENSIISETWHHLALTYDGSNMILYIDGIEAGSTEAYGQITNGSVPLTIGRLVFDNTNFDLDGQVDEVGLWNHALTAQEIQDNMYTDLTGEEGLVGHWNFNEGSGDIANDVSGNDNDGSINGATWSTNVPFSGDVQCDSSEVELWDECYSIENTTVLDLNDSGLTGPIPPEIGDLENLTFLDLTSNDLTGSIPPEIGDLTDLTHFNLDNNQLTGPIPPEIGSLTSLNGLWLNDNGLTGSIPLEIGGLEGLTALGLGGNNLTGPILSDIGNLTNLTVLYLNNNQLTGEIPESICDLPEDCIIYLSNNQLCPPYPSCVEDHVGEQDTDNCEQVSILDGALPIAHKLYNAFPNPFNPVTTLHYGLPENELVNITIYDMMGRIIKTLMNGEQTAGYKSVQWNSTNNAGQLVGAGLYLYTIQAGGFRQTKKIVLLR